MANKSFSEQLSEFDINDIDFSRVGVWPLPGKLALCFIVVAGIVAGFYFGLIKKQMETFDFEQRREETLRAEFKRKAKDAANLEAYRVQLAEMEVTLGALISRLPTDTEVPGLLEDIDDKGVDSRLVINEVKLEPELAHDVHVELPISINVSGGFHEFGAFVSGVAGMPRIVTLHDFSIAPEDKGSNVLVMEIEARTYRYKSEE